MTAILLGYELGPMVLGYLTNKTPHSDQELQQIPSKSFTEREKSIISYLSGYVFSTFYRRIRNSNSWKSNISQQYLQILRVGKEEKESLQSGNTLTTIKNRGGLWFVKKDVVSIFTIIEKHVLLHTKKFVKKNRLQGNS